MLDFGLLVLRLFGGGLMLFNHGLPKLLNYSTMATQFGDPLGFGPTPTLMLAIFAEFICSALVILGLFSRLALIPLMSTMSTAFFIVHSADPMQRKELPLLFLGVFIALFLTGPGRYSVQEFFRISAGRLNWLLR